MDTPHTPFPDGPSATPAARPDNRTGLPLGPDAPWLAPLAGYSDLPFRLLCRELGAAVACTEMVSVRGLLFGTKATLPLLATCPADAPLVVQLFGTEPDEFARSMDMLLPLGFTHFDLNAGCPVRKVIKSGSGSALLDHPGRIGGILSAMSRAAGPGRVGVKIRLGVDSARETFLAVAEEAQRAGAGWITLHPRWGKQMFMGQAHHHRLPELVAATPLPVLASGDLFTAGDGVRCVGQTGVAGVMFARGALYDPSVFDRYRALLDGRELPDPGGPEVAALVRRHAALVREHDPGGFRKMRSIIPRYLRGLEGIKRLRTRLLACPGWEELEEVVAEIATLFPAPGSPAAEALKARADRFL